MTTSHLLLAVLVLPTSVGDQYANVPVESPEDGHATPNGNPVLNSAALNDVRRLLLGRYIQMSPGPPIADWAMDEGPEMPGGVVE